MDQEWDRPFRELCSRCDDLAEDLRSRLEDLEAVQGWYRQDREDLWRAFEELPRGESVPAAQGATAEGDPGGLADLRAGLDRLEARQEVLHEGLDGLRVELGRMDGLLADLRGASASSRADLEAEVRELREEVRQLRRDQDLPVARVLEDMLAAPVESSPDPPASAPPGVEVLRSLAGRLERLAGLVPGDGGRRVASELEPLRAVVRDLESETHWQERASAVLQVLERRLLAGGPGQQARRQARVFLCERLPDLLEDLDDLHRGAELPTGALAAIHRELGGILEDAGLEEVRPRRGDPLDRAEHSLLRVERTAGEGLGGRVAACLRPGLRWRATGQTVRRAEVSVFP